MRHLHKGVEDHKGDGAMSPFSRPVGRVALRFRGRPPSLPFARTAAVFAGLVTFPPLVPIFESHLWTDLGSLVKGYSAITA